MAPRASSATPLRGLVLCAAALVLMAACREREPERPAPAAAGARPNVLLVTIDTLRPDALGWVSGANDTPALDGLARGGFRFPAGVSPVPLTMPAHASLMTGLVPRRHGVRDNGQVLGPGAPTLAEALQRQGYATAAFISGFPLSRTFGIDRGFARFDDELTAGEGAWLERPAPQTTAAVLSWVASTRSPWFLWIHYYDPHFPYEPPAGFVRPGRRGAYDGEVALVDQAFGEAWSELGRRSPDGLLTVFAADHGESLGEHGEGTHGFFIYDSTIAVPIVFHFLGRVASGESRAPARLVDVAPTVLELLAAPPLPGIDGTSLASTLAGRAQEIPPAYLETWQPWTSYGWSPLRGIRRGPWKLIAAPRPELYDLRQDPREERNVLESERRAAGELRAALAKVEALPAARSAAVLDAETQARLSALGYAGGGTPAGQEPPPGLPDPKDRVLLREVLTEGEELLRGGRPAEALAKFEQVLAEEPDNRFAVVRSGIALLQAGDAGRAVPRLRRAATLAPDQPEVREALAQALARVGDHAGAAAQRMELVRLQPRNAQAWSNLGATLGLAKRFDEAVAAYKRAVELSPGNADRLARLAFAEHAAGRVPDAVRYLEQAAAVTGPEAFPHAGALGILLADLGRRDEARAWLARSRPGQGDFAHARLRLAALELASGRQGAARAALSEALAAEPGLRAQVAADPELRGLLP